MKKDIDILIHARWIIPVEPDEVVLEHHALAIHEGRILDILPSASTADKYQAATTHHLEHHTLIPGLVNSHTHSPMSLLRGLADDIPLMEWLNKHIWPAEQQWVNEAFVHDGTQLAIAEMLRAGVTCFNDMYFYPEVTARVATQVGMRATVGLIVLDFPSSWAASADEYIDKGLALHDKYLNDPLIYTAFAPHAPYTVSDEPFKRLEMLNNELEIPIHIHVHETADEIEQSLKQYGVRPLQRLSSLGLLSPSLLAVHMTQLTDEEIELVAAHGVNVVHCPESNLKLASGFCPASRLARAGVNVALGTDGAASNNDLDMMGEMRSAALLGKAVAQDASALPASEVLRMATLNGAKCLNLDHKIGSLVPGKAADVVAVRFNSIESQPLYHPVSQLVYATGRDQVTDVWINGEHLLNRRRLTSMDEHEILDRTRHWRDKIMRGNHKA